MHKMIRERRSAFRLAALAVVALLAACADGTSAWRMPDNIKDTRKLLSPEEQRQAITELSKKKPAQPDEPTPQGEKLKN